MLSERELAFIAIHKDSYPSVFKFVRRRVESADIAEEIAADVFRVVWQKWTDESTPELPYLLTVARNLVGNAYRSRDRRLALQEKLRTTAVQRFGDDSENVVVQDALMRMREQDREILQLAYWDGLGTAEISGVLQCSESAAKVRLHRARTAFRKQMPAAEFTTQKLGA
ncbi:MULTISPECIES: RNA polymerase sigma factor [Paenarthrobacter]|uniref:RNA polymerase sigma factor n=1 Tax=Paenarthrobacter TaxID=1742992 RepID=UPI0021C98C28|nr:MULTISPECIES: sigma-70 family RNA polymerase sigma factor [Paenarthrobacter]MDD7834535.1 sigma-70 family RNA polymerase sigma factor [Paenarthrobacter sp. AB444]MDP9936527.1 RNA polymerase sigma-70 factor (ECF subfamily) [Paenarthrobacter nicotinovorans]UXM91976.1 sigma-70 family RNA polymerase sigma factor [Paenarthrobacter sp. JL.01a]